MDGVSRFETSIAGSRFRAGEPPGKRSTGSQEAMYSFATGKKVIKQEVQITNKMGLHARPAMQFVDLASKFTSKITVSKDCQSVNGKSIMEMMLLAAGPGTTIALLAEGSDAEQAVAALKKLIDSKFDEE